MRAVRANVLAMLVTSTFAVSPVQKVVELMDQCKAKVEKDLAAEAKAMEEYTTFCDDELKNKGYAIKTATREIGDLEAVIEDAKAQIISYADEVDMASKLVAGKERELAEATKLRSEARADFEVAEAEMKKSVDQLSTAATLIKKSMSFLQLSTTTPRNYRTLAKQLAPVAQALSGIVDAAWLDAGSKRNLKSLLQSVQGGKAAAEDKDADELSLFKYEHQMKQPQAKMVAYESKSGNIVQTIEDMQSKAEDALSEVRKKEMQAAHNFNMVKQTLETAIKEGNEKVKNAVAGKSSYGQKEQTATGDLAEAKKTKAADETYSETLKTECEIKASDWAERQKSANGELAAIAKAKEILVSGVKAFVQVSIGTKKRMRRNANANEEEEDMDDSDADDEDDAQARMGASRQKVITLLKKLGRAHHSFKLMQIASTAATDPFVKIRGLIEDMISKLLTEAQEDATHEAFCNEELSKSKKSQEQKENAIGKYKSRIDAAKTSIAELKEGVKTLESEIATIDKAQAEATEIRATEHADYIAAATDFKESAEAVSGAIGVLKSFYQGTAMLVQLKQKSKQPSFGGAQSDAASGIISILEVAESDFRSSLAEADATEQQAVDAYDKLTQENKVSKATKSADAKGKSSEIKSLKVTFNHATEDHEEVSAELDAVMAYLDKLKPECETKVMSYEERKAAREAEIEGLKQALGILEVDGR